MKNLFFLTLIFFIASCTKSELSVEVKGQVFQCCNIWQDFVTTENTHEEAVTDFLDNNNIAFSNFQTINNGVIAICVTCCLCPEGKEVRFKVSEENLATVLALGFEEN
jgi:hypothetical protein